MEEMRPTFLELLAAEMADARNLQARRDGGNVKSHDILALEQRFLLLVSGNGIIHQSCIQKEDPGATAIMKDKNDEDCKVFLHHGERFREAKGIIINTFGELEPASLKALVDGRCLHDHPMLSIFPVGPLLALEPQKNGSEYHECIKWLDGQSMTSVVFLCFGSIGCFEHPQVKELAEGLERSGHRFLWVLRSPSNDKSWFPTDSNLDEVLPEGFLERIKERGMVWPSWAPQIEILAHPAVWGFVTHCGWNSCLESLWFGVPMLAWPLYAEQPSKWLLGLGVA